MRTDNSKINSILSIITARNILFALSFPEHKDTKFHHLCSPPLLLTHLNTVYISNNLSCSHLQKKCIKRPTLFKSSRSRPSGSSCTLLDPSKR